MKVFTLRSASRIPEQSDAWQNLKQCRDDWETVSQDHLITISTGYVLYPRCIASAELNNSWSCFQKCQSRSEQQRPRSSWPVSRWPSKRRSAKNAPGEDAKTCHHLVDSQRAALKIGQENCKLSTRSCVDFRELQNVQTQKRSTDSTNLRIKSHTGSRRRMYSLFCSDLIWSSTFISEISLLST